MGHSGVGPQLTLPESSYEHKHMDILKRDTVTSPPSPWIKGIKSSAAGAGSSAKFAPLPYIFSLPNTSLHAGRKAHLIEYILFIVMKREMRKICLKLYQFQAFINYQAYTDSRRDEVARGLSIAKELLPHLTSLICCIKISVKIQRNHIYLVTL